MNFTPLLTLGGLLTLCLPCPSARAQANSTGSTNSTRAWRADTREVFVLEAGLDGLRAELRADGLTVRGRSSTLTREQRDVEVTVRTTSFGRVGAARELGAGALELDRSRAQLVRPGIVEWFEPRSDGVEQGWTIAAPPAGEATVPLWLGLEFTGLHPQIAEDGKSARLVDERAQDRLYYRGLAAVDSTGRHLGARMLSESSGMALIIDDRGAAYPIVVDPVLSTRILLFEPDQVDARLSSLGCGDFNGDGYSDIVVGSGAYDAPPGLSDSGGVFGFMGSASGIVGAPTWTPTSPASAALLGFGSWLLSLGDVNGDGFDDLGVVSYGWSNPEVDEGAVFVYFGSSTGLAPVPGWVIEGNEPGAHLQAGLYPGDIDGDGFNDIILNFTSSAGVERVQVVRGGPGAVPGPVLWTITENDLVPLLDPLIFNSLLGSSVGDVNADGFDDLLIGAQYHDSGRGMSLLFLGGPTGPASVVPTWTATASGAGPGSYFGVYQAPAGDLNGDGYADVAIPAPFYPGAGAPDGRIFVFLGNPIANPATVLPITPSHVIVGGTNDGLGTGCSAAGDVDGDGFADLLVGAYQGCVGSPSPGYARLFRGGALATGVDPTPAVTINGPSPESCFGNGSGGGVRGVGDVNGDGRHDVVIMSFYFTNGQVGEGAAFLCYGQPDDVPLRAPLLGQTPSIGGSSGSSYGTALTTAGDVNGDGFSDLLVGSPDFDGALIDQGRVLLYLGSANGIDSTAVWTFASGVSGAKLGAAVSFAGDVNNDGFTDVLLGAPRLANGQFQEGRAYFFFGNASGALASAPDWTFETNEAIAKVGEALAGAGDIDGDGYTDVFVGAPGATVSGVPNSGRVYVFQGGQAGLPLTPTTVIDNPVLGDGRFGAALAYAGDVNRDGRTDLLVGAPDYAAPEFREGRAYLFLGNINGISPTPAFTVESNVANALLGAAVSAAGDVDADGNADVLIGAPDFTGGGRVWLYRGSSSGSPLAASPQVFNSTQGNSRFGAALCRAGDVNNDGFGDVAIAAPNFNTNQGEVYVHLGVSSGLATSPAMTFPGSAGANLGAGMGPCGDIDGDGFSDVILGAPGQLSGSGGLVIYMGSTQYGPVARVQQRRVSAAVAYDLLALQSEQVDQIRLTGGPNTFSDRASTPAGRERVAIEWEMKGGTALLNGTGLEIGAFQDSGPPTAPLRLDVIDNTGIAAGERYQWRQRIATRNPLFPHGLWTTIQGNGKHEKKFGTGFDCNSNGIPDVTDLAQNPSLDCDSNAQIDSCQIALDPSLDCDTDGILNTCELFANDCDGDGCPDDCELAGTVSGLTCTPASDCNANNVLDACELSPATDANGDSILDVCQFTPYCFGDGTGTACPCGNSGGAGRGCANSVNASGAVLTVTGWPSIANDTLVLRGAGMPNSASPSAIYLQGTAQDNGGLGTPIQDGLRCVTGSLIRLGTRPNSGNQSQYPDVGNVIVSIRGGLVALPMPQTRHYQVFYRNAAAAFCPPGTANWTNGLSIVWGP